MLEFTTYNSTYRVNVSVDGVFIITKVGETRHSDYIKINETRLSKTLYLRMGECAGCDGWATSPVRAIRFVE